MNFGYAVQHLIRVSWAIALVLGLWVWGGWGAIAHAATVDPAHQTAIAVDVSLGNAGDELKFFPSNITFKAGQRYKLHLVNPSHVKHYFTAKDFADTIWTQKVDAGNVEIKGAIHELELRPSTNADWVFVPQKAGTYTLRCTIPGHTEAGMTGMITVTP